MKKYAPVFLFLLLALVSPAAHAQTTVANFDNPVCTSSSVGVYEGIDFSLSPWACGKVTLVGETGTSISWYQAITTGRFKFQVPHVLASVSAAVSSGSGTMTITTDAGETFSHAVTTTYQTLRTGFSEAASVVTVHYPGGKTLRLDNLTYQSVGKLGVAGTLTWNDGTPVTGSVTFIQVISSTSQKTLGTFPVSSTGAVSGAVTIDLSQADPLTFKVNLQSTSNVTLGSSSFQVLKAMFPVTATGINAKIVLWKQNATIKTFSFGLTP